jgi:hypothetical protein
MTITPFLAPASPRLLALPLKRVGRVLALVSLLVMGAVWTPLGASAAQQDRWVGDVPIMDGLVIEPELGFAFDSPSGRIVMIFASNANSSADILAFYDSALPGLGWVGGNGNWQRGPEKLSVTKVKTAAGALWKIMLRPN